MLALAARSDETPTPMLTPLHGLTTQQRRMLEAIDQYWRATGEPCPGRILARRCNLHHSTIQKHLTALHRKGWLRTASAPAYLVQFVD
jgi:DNA-binding IclR family transcriptional regulator